MGRVIKANMFINACMSDNDSLNRIELQMQIFSQTTLSLTT